MFSNSSGFLLIFVHLRLTPSQVLVEVIVPLVQTFGDGWCGCYLRDLLLLQMQYCGGPGSFGLLGRGN